LFYLCKNDKGVLLSLLFFTKTFLAIIPLFNHPFSGVETSVNGLMSVLKAMRNAGVNHIGLHFRRNEFPIEWALKHIGEHVLPKFHN
jgi:hypothetical protein